MEPNANTHAFRQAIVAVAAIVACGAALLNASFPFIAAEERVTPPLPHVIWTRTFFGGEFGQPRFYTHCTYTGPYGEFTIPANQGTCKLVVWFQKNELVQP
jgi:hypothetical protein